MRRRVSNLAGEYWWEKEEIFLGRGDELGLESIVIIGLLYLYMNVAVQGLCWMVPASCQRIRLRYYSLTPSPSSPLPLQPKPI